MCARPALRCWTLALLLLAAAHGLPACGHKRTHVLTPDGSASFAVMDFSAPFPLDPPPDGWYHREFLTRKSVDLSFATVEGVHALRVATDDSASMLFRHVDIPLDEYPILSWRWYIERGIESDADERTVEGDDHPARLYLAFEAADGEARTLEIIWGNTRLRAGDYKHVGGFPHYVANGGAENIGRWHAESVDLRPIYTELWGDPSGARLLDVAIFCDSDETDGSSLAYFADVRAQRASE